MALSRVSGRSPEKEIRIHIKDANVGIDLNRHIQKDHTTYPAKTRSKPEPVAEVMDSPFQDIRRRNALEFLTPARRGCFPIVYFIAQHY
jgi:hypothetical protein